MSDVHYWTRGRISHFIVNSPMVIGHECSGIISSVGPGVKDLQPGDRVAIEAGVPCMDSKWSREGRYNLDPDIAFYATPPYHGGLASKVDHPAQWCYKLPDNVSLEEGALCEPLSVGVHACRRAGVSPGKSVAIMGAGPIGLVTLLVAKAFGADVVAITDLKARNLELAKELGADICHTVARGDAPEDTATSLKKSANAPDGFDIVIDCAGFESTIRTAIKTATSGGKMVLVGLGQDEVKIPIAEASIREVDILGSFRYANTYPLCLSLISTGKVNVKPLITHRFGFNEQDVLDGFTTAKNAETNGAIKVMFNL